MEYIALCASLFLKNALISERKFVTLCTGIGLSFLLFCHYKDTHFLQQTEIPMPFLCTNTSYYCQLAKLEYIINPCIVLILHLCIRMFIKILSNCVVNIFSRAIKEYLNITLLMVFSVLNIL